jgi:hypothetical protein
MQVTSKENIYLTRPMAVNCQSYMANYIITTFLNKIKVTVYSVFFEDEKIRVTIPSDARVTSEFIESMNNALENFDCDAWRDKAPITTPEAGDGPLAFLVYDFKTKTIRHAQNVTSVGLYRGRGLIINFAVPLPEHYSFIAECKFNGGRVFPMYEVKRTETSIHLMPRRFYKNDARQNYTISFIGNWS